MLGHRKIGSAPIARKVGTERAPVVSIVQPAVKQQLSNATTDNYSFPSLPTIGNTIVVIANVWSGSGIHTLTVTDNQSNTYTTQIANPTGQVNTVVATAPVTTSSGTFTVTASFSGTVDGSWTAFEVSGLSSATADSTGSNQNPDSAAAVSELNTGSTGTLSQREQFVVASTSINGFANANNSDINIVHPQGWTELVTENDSQTYIGGAASSLVVSSTAAVSATYGFDESDGDAAAVVAAFPVSLPVTATLSGTAVGSNTEASIAANDKTIIITLQNGTWVTAGATFDAQRQSILDSFVSDVTEANGFNEERANVLLSNVVRTSDTVVTITLNDMSAIDVEQTHTVSCSGIPAAAIDGAITAVVPSQTFTITALIESITPVEFQANQPFQRVYDGNVANVAVKPFAYSSIVGVDSVEYRLLDSLGSTVRQDWTVLASLTLGATGTGTMSVPTSRDSYRYQLRTKDSGGTVLATSAIMTNEFRAGIGIALSGDSDPSGFMNQGPAHALANGVWRFNNTSNAWENTGATIAIGAMVLVANQLAADEDCAVFLIDGTKVGGSLLEYQSAGGAMYDELVRIRNACETDVEIHYACLGANDVFGGTLDFATVKGQYDTYHGNLRSIFGTDSRLAPIPPSRDDNGGNDANWETLRHAHKASCDGLPFAYYSASFMWEAMESFHYPDSVEQVRGRDILLQTARFILGSATFYRGPTVTNWSINVSNLATVNFAHSGTDITVSATDNGLDFKNNGTLVAQSTVTKVNSTTVTVQLAGPANTLSIGEGSIPFPAGEGIVDNVSFGLSSTGLVVQPVFDLAPSIIVNDTINLGYSVRNYANSDNAGAFSVLNFANQSISSGSTVSNFIGQALSSAYTVNNYASHNLSSGYLVRNEASRNLSGAFTARAYANANFNSGFSVESFGSVSSALSSSYRVRAYVSDTLASAHQVLGLVSANLNGSFTVQNAGSASRVLSGSYRVRNYVSQASSLAYSVRNYVSAANNSAFSIRSQVNDSASLSYTVRNYSYASLPGSFSVVGLQSVGLSLSVSYTVYGFIGGTVSLGFSVENYGEHQRFPLAGIRQTYPLEGQ